MLGTYDIGKPRVRIMRQSFLESDQCHVTEIHLNPWEGIEDKSQLNGIRKLGIGFKMPAIYPRLLWRYFKAPPHEIVVCGYMGLFDVLLLGIIARLRGKRVVWDMFFSLYDTVVNDRKQYGKYHPTSLFLYVSEWLACRIAHTVVLDTQVHSHCIATLFHVKHKKMKAVLVGAEEDIFPPAPPSTRNPDDSFHVLFYGQYIPLQSVPTIYKAALLNKDPTIHWTIIGQGQDLATIEALEKDTVPQNWQRIPWVPYEELYKYIHRADVCLGIFGESKKAAAVIPNKNYQALACGKPIITRETKALMELPKIIQERCLTIPAKDPEELMKAVLAIKKRDIDVEFKSLSATIQQQWRGVINNP